MFFKETKTRRTHHKASKRDNKHFDSLCNNKPWTKKLCQALKLSDLTCPIRRRLKWLLLIMVSLFWRETNSHYWCKKNDLLKARLAKKKFKIVTNILRYGITTEQRLQSLFLRKRLQGEIRCFGNSEWKVAETWGLKFRCVSADGLRRETCYM